MSEFELVEEIVQAGMPPIERTARRLLGLACVLAVAASAILVVDFMIKGQILRKAEEVSRGLMGEGRSDDVPGAGVAVHGVADVEPPATDDEGDAASEDAPVSVG